MSEPKPLRLLLIAPNCDGTDVGEAWSTYQWVKGLGRRHQVTVLTYNKRVRPSAASQLSGVEVVEWRDLPFVGAFRRFNSGVKLGYLPFYLRARAWLSKHAVGSEFDLVHQLSPLALRYPSPAAGLGIPLVLGPVGGSIPTPEGFRSRMGKTPWYTRLRGLDRLRLRYDPLLRRTYERADMVIGVGPYVKELLGPLSVRRFEAMSETGLVSLPGDRVEAASGRRRPHRVLFVGRLARAKGAREAIMAMARIADLPDVILDVVGDGEDRVHCEGLVARLGLSDRVRFHGQVPRALVEPFYRQADVFLFPSIREPSGNVVVEAMSHGLALVIAGNGGPAYAADGECAIRIRVGESGQYVEDLALAVRRLVVDGELLGRMQAASRKRAAELFLWDRKIDRMCGLYEAVLGRGR